MLAQRKMWAPLSSRKQRAKNKSPLLSTDEGAASRLVHNRPWQGIAAILSHISHTLDEFNQS